MTVIYVDTLFLLNAMVDYLLLLAAARLAGEPLARLRFLLGALLGGGYAVAIFLPGLAFLRHPLCRGAAAVLMLLAAYGGSRRLVRQGVIFLALSCAFAGGVLAVGLMGGQGLALGRSGVIYSPLDLKLVLLSAAGCYGALTMAFSRVGRHTAASGELLPVRLTIGERTAELVALVDTGNTLTDPASGRPVMVAEGDRLTALFPKECRPERDDLEDPASGLVRLGRGACTVLSAALSGGGGEPGPAAGGAGGPDPTGGGEQGAAAGGPVSHAGVGRGRIWGADRPFMMERTDGG